MLYNIYNCGTFKCSKIFHNGTFRMVLMSLTVKTKTKTLCLSYSSKLQNISLLIKLSDKP